jgi:cobalt/nickel transport system ATP-binding protein
MANALFELSRVHYSYLGKIPALCGVDLTIEKGSRVAVIGANGTGKSTLLAMLDALVFPDEGVVQAFGEVLTERVLNDVAFSRAFRSRVGFVFQNPDVQLFCPTVREDIIFGPLQLGVSPVEVESRLDALARDFKIAHLLERSPHQLSIGEKRKVAIASVLAVKPEVLLLDEPTAGLDPRTTRDIIDLILAESATGKTIVTATHDMHIVEEIADTVHVFSVEKKVIHSDHSGRVLSDQALLQEHNLVHIHSHHHGDKVHTNVHQHAQHHV